MDIIDFFCAVMFCTHVIFKVMWEKEEFLSPSREIV